MIASRRWSRPERSPAEPEGRSVQGEAEAETNAGALPRESPLRQGWSGPGFHFFLVSSLNTRGLSSGLLGSGRAGIRFQLNFCPR